MDSKQEVMGERVEKRFFAKVNKTDGCWLWTATKINTGYGQFSYNGKTLLAHRFAYEYFNKPIPHGLTIDHLCRTKDCVNPDHLRAVTIQENIEAAYGLTMINKEKTNCIRGHEFTDSNTIRSIGRHGKPQRECRACHNTRTSEYRARKLKEISHAI